MDRVLRATAVVVPWLRKNDCQQAVLSLTDVMVVHVAFACTAAAQQGKSCGDGDLPPVPRSGQSGWAVRPQALLCPWSLSLVLYL